MHRSAGDSADASPRLLRSSPRTAKSIRSRASGSPSETLQEPGDHAQRAQKRKRVEKDDCTQKPAAAPAGWSPRHHDGLQPRESKRRNGVENGSSYKEHYRSGLGSELSENNLRKLQEDLEQLHSDVLGNMEASATFPDQARKRHMSRQTSCSDLNQETESRRSQKSSASNSFYRYRILDQARVYIRPEPPPQSIQAQLDIMFKSQIPDGRWNEVLAIARKTSKRFMNKLCGAHREDDLVEILYEALNALDENEIYDFPRKADWDPSLKPDNQPVLWDFSALNQFSKKASHPPPGETPQDQRNQEQSFPPPQSIMPPPTTPYPFGSESIKTPRPDFTIGLRHSVISSALVQRGLNKTRSDDFLKVLQRERELISDPTQNFLNVRFPFLVIEGKSYATGKTIFEAQNQAAVSGACMINVQQKLTDLYQDTFPVRKGRKLNIAFSICTEGPQLEFWVHYDLVEDGVRSHYMNILRSCHGSLTINLRDFLMAIDCLMRWIKEVFLRDIADQLRDLARHAAHEQAVTVQNSV